MYVDRLHEPIACEPWACRSQGGETASLMPALAAALNHRVDVALGELAAALVERRTP